MIEILLIDPVSGTTVSKVVEDKDEWPFREALAKLADEVGKSASKESFEVLFNLDPVISVRVSNA